MHGPAGIIQSPSFPSRYPHNTECVWQVQADTSFRIVFSFTERFDLESSNNCQNDYVEVSDFQILKIDLSVVYFKLSKFSYVFFNA